MQAPSKYLFFLLIFFFAFLKAPARNVSKPQVTIGLLVDGRSPILIDLMDRVKAETETLLKASHQLEFPDQYTLFGDFDLDRLDQQFNILLNEKQVDYIITIGPNASAVVLKSKKYAKPVIAGNIINPKMQQIPLTSDSTSGIRNFTFVMSPFSPENDLKTFYELFPFTKLAILMNKGIKDLIPMEEFLDPVFNEFYGPATYEIIETGESADEALQNLPDDVDAVYTTGLLQMPKEEYLKLIDGINSRKLPSFSLLGLDGVKDGIWAGLAMPTNFERLSRRIALNVQRMLKGEKPENIPVTMTYQYSLAINLPTAYQIDYFPNWQTLNDAVLIGEETLQRGEEISLETAVDDALSYNLNINSADKNVAAGIQRVYEARADLLPQLLAQNTFLYIDLNIPGSILNIKNLFIGTLNGTFQQMIYDEKEVAEFAIERYNQIERNEVKRQVELDVVEQVANTYLEVLKAKITESVQIENVALSRKNLQLAKVRFQVGYSGPSDVYRFESELASSRSRLVAARVRRRTVEQTLNTLLNRPVNSYFYTDSVTLASLDLLYLDEQIKPFWDDPVSYDKLGDFMIRKARKTLPELNQVEAKLLAQERFRKFSKRQFYVPKAFARVNMIYLYLREGEGLDDPIDVGLPTGPVLIPDGNFFNYFITLNVQYPIFLGLKRSALYQRSVIELDRLEIEKSNTLLQVEQQTRRQLNELRSSYANITYFKIAEGAAYKNLEIVQDAYSKGQESLIRLLDAQNQAIRARELSSNAVYSFLSNLISLERSLGYYTFLMSPEEKEAYITEIMLFMQQQQ